MKTTTRMNRLDMEYPQCLWMQAGVVSRKLCKDDFSCPECHYDRVMKAIASENQILRDNHRVPKGNRRKIVSWKDKLRAKHISKRPCIHHMKGSIEFRICNNEYHCGNCDFDQYFDDQYTVHTVVKPIEASDIKGFKIPQGYYFHHGHAWVRIEEGDSVRIGIDDFALRLFGPLDRIEAPLMGKQVKQGRADISLVRGKNQAKVLSPISGVVTSINAKLREVGRIANDAPYAEGWVMIVKPHNMRHDLKKLMIQQETANFMTGHVERLYEEIETIAGPLAADGGYLGNDIYGHLPQADWNRLARVFLNT